MEPKILIFYTLILFERKVHSDLNIQDCSSGTINVREDTGLSLTCGQYTTQIDWYSSFNSQSRTYIATCDKTSCYPNQGTQFVLNVESSLSNPWTYKSNLYIPTVTRDKYGFIYCADRYHTEGQDTCRLRVTVPATSIPENCRVWISNWQVKGQCLVERMYASDSVYKCTWSVNNTELPDGFEEPLTSWTNWIDWYEWPAYRTYVRGNCSFRQNLASKRNRYTYIISIDPGPQNFVVKTINIEPPEKPTLNCPETVLEGSTVSCMCTSPNKGNPPAKIVWDGLSTDNLLLHNVQRQNSSTNYTCRQTWGTYYSTVNYSFTVSYEQNRHQSSGSTNRGLIGGVVAAAICAIIIGAVVVVFIIKRRKEEFSSGRFTSRFWPYALKFFRKKTPLSTPYATVNKPKSETPLKRFAAPSGDLYTRATNTISLDVSGDYVTVSDTMENPVTGMDRDCTFMENQFRHEPTELTKAVKLTMNPKPTTERTKNIQDTTGIVYMNVTEVPTDSGLGVYHIVPWRTMAAEGETDQMNDSTKAVSDDEYNVLSFEEDRSGQEDQADTYHHLEHE